MRWIEGAMIVSFLEQVLKLFWDNCKWVVLSHLLEKCCTFLHFFFKCWLGAHFFFFNCLYNFSFQVCWFLNTGIDQQHQYLFYKLLNTSVTLFLHIFWRDFHSWLTALRGRRARPLAKITEKKAFKLFDWGVWAK